jgi:hypothetical protein
MKYGADLLAFIHFTPLEAQVLMGTEWNMGSKGHSSITELCNRYFQTNS